MVSTKCVQGSSTKILERRCQSISDKRRSIDSFQFDLFPLYIKYGPLTLQCLFFLMKEKYRLLLKVNEVSCSQALLRLAVVFLPWSTSAFFS